MKKLLLGAFVLMFSLLVSSVSYAPPMITGFGPGSGPGGTLVSVSGVNLLNVTDVTFFNGVPAVIISVAGAGTQINTSVPDGATTGPISVTTPGGTATSASNFVVDLAVVPVPVDIKPQSCPNPLNIKAKGVLPVAILGTGEFDVSDINPQSLQLLGVVPVRHALEDVATPFVPSNGNNNDHECTDAGPDGFTDMTLKFDAQAVIQAIEASLGRPVTDGEELVLPLEGELFDGTPFVGEDVVVILKKGR